MAGSKQMASRDIAESHLENFPVLQPIRIGGKRLRNRIVCSPISINLADKSGEVTPKIIDFYSSMGRTGVGLVTVGATAVSPEGGSTDSGMRIGPENLRPGLEQLADSIRATGALSSLQLFHVGAQGNTNYSGQPVFGPSSYVCPDIGIEATVLSATQIERIEDDFVNGIIVGLECGFDFVELHIAHGYLLHEFISPYFNKRTDQYGGTEEARFLMISNIVSKLNAESNGAMEKVGARISGNDFLADGMDVAKNRPIVELFERNQAAYWVVSAGIYETAKQKYIHMKKGDYWRYAGQLKAISNIPVVAQGGIRTLEMGNEILGQGNGDMIGFAQALIADSGLISKSLSKREDEVVPCIECGRCRYVRRKDLTFACVLPSSDFYQAGLLNDT